MFVIPLNGIICDPLLKLLYFIDIAYIHQCCNSLDFESLKTLKRCLLPLKSPKEKLKLVALSFLINVNPTKIVYRI